MKQNNTLPSLLILLTAALLTSCSAVRYTYFDKQKVPYTAHEETKLAKTIPAKPFLNQEEKQVRENTSPIQGSKPEQKSTTAKDVQKKQNSPSKLEQVFNNLSIPKYIPNENKGIQSENRTNDDDRTLLIVLLVILILILIALIGDVLGLLLLALLILIIYFLLKALGVFS